VKLLKHAASLLTPLALVALLHCGDDDTLKIECKLAADGKSCDCTPGNEVLGFCNPAAGIPSLPAVCCAPEGWPASGLHCTCEQIICVTTDQGCRCTRATERQQPGGEEVATCPLPSSDTVRCCIDKTGNCGCYPKAADQCGDGATDVATCDYNTPKLACPAGQHTTTTCEQ